jgi:translocation and assembly module TamA
MTQSVFALLIAVAAFGSLAHAADPQPYRVEIASVGNGDMDATLKSTSDLLSLRRTAPVSPFGLIARARSDVDRLTTALESFGYYQCRVTIKINDMVVNNPGLGDALSALPKGQDARVAIGFALGPLYHLRRVDIDGDLPDEERSTLGLTGGEPAAASTVLAGGARLLTALQERGYAFAKVDPRSPTRPRTRPCSTFAFTSWSDPRRISVRSTSRVCSGCTSPWCEPGSRCIPVIPTVRPR